jgi:hypothetical protein
MAHNKAFGSEPKCCKSESCPDTKLRRATFSPIEEPPIIVVLS